MISELMVDLSRWQFTVTALYHFIFVPLTLGISWIVFIMELIYVSTGNTLYRDMTKFWAKLFGINFAIGVATGITMEFEFGTNWSNYSHYVGDIFGAPLAIEGLLAFFLESTFIGLMFTGWNRFSKKTHLVITFLTALGSNLSAMWILIANGWMQYPEFAQFSPEKMRMEMVDFWGLVFSPIAQVKFAHTVSGAYITASIFVIAISAYYLLKNKFVLFAKRSITVALAFGFCAMGASALTGDLSAIQITQHQPAKLAAMEAEYETQEAPAWWSVFAIPNEEKLENTFSIKVPYLLGLIATHSLDTEVIGLKDIIDINKQRIVNGAVAYNSLQKIRSGNSDEFDVANFEENKADLGYGLLLQRYAKDISDPTDEEIAVAARNSVPSVWISYFSFRLMMGIVGLIGLLYLVIAYFHWYKKEITNRPKLLKVMLFSLPLPFIACEAGWVLAEVGRQPWAIQDILPTFSATSTLQAVDIGISLACFIAIYTIFLIIEATLMVKAVKKGPNVKACQNVKELS